jgi:uncharacterized protein (DUF2141 family)
VRHRSRSLQALSLAIVAPALAGAAPVAGHVRATVTGLRSGKGQVLACLTALPAAFPDCAKDPAAHVAKAPAAAQVELDFGPVPEGHYAISLFHDENGNGRLDKRLILPREGYGFSRDAPVRMGPPSFASAAFAVGAGGGHPTIRMRYLF